MATSPLLQQCQNAAGLSESAIMVIKGLDARTGQTDNIGIKM